MSGKSTLPRAFVMNMFYSGLGIARSLGEHGIRVVGLSAVRGLYGNFTRYAKVIAAPDSRTHPEALLRFLLACREHPHDKGIIFPTRDADIVFLHRFRKELEPHFTLAIPNPPAIEACLDKWRTYETALRVGVPVPKTWKLDGEESVRRTLPEVCFPCILKPLAAHRWREDRNWQIVGERKAIIIHTPQQFVEEYERAAQADPRALLQEMIPGNDYHLRIAAVYCDRNSEIQVAFNTQKILQFPVHVGTGCIVQSSQCPELFPLTARLLAGMSFTGIAEVEFKWNATKREYQLIEVNARPWDQHRLGAALGRDVIWAAYRDYAGLFQTRSSKQFQALKWIGEDALLYNVPRLLWRGDLTLSSLLRLLRGKRIFAIWSAADPLPFSVYFVKDFLPNLATAVIRYVRDSVTGRYPNSKQRRIGNQQGKDHA